MGSKSQISEAKKEQRTGAGLFWKLRPFARRWQWYRARQCLLVQRTQEPIPPARFPSLSRKQLRGSHFFLSDHQYQLHTSYGTHLHWSGILSYISGGTIRRQPGERRQSGSWHLTSFLPYFTQSRDLCHVHSHELRMPSSSDLCGYSGLQKPGVDYFPDPNSSRT
jgi:hypothetical protein